MTADETRVLVRRYLEAFNASDHEAMLALLAEDVAHDINQGGREIGKEKFRWFNAKMSRHYDEQLGDIVIMVDETGTHAAAEFTVRGTYLETADGLPPVERPLTDRAAITAWLSDRLGLPVAPPGLTKAGLHLTGARVLPSENGPVAFLLYEDSAGQRTALTIGRTGMDTDDTAFRFAGHDGVENIAWTDGGLTFTVTGQTGQDALRRIAAAVYAQMD